MKLTAASEASATSNRVLLFGKSKNWSKCGLNKEQISATKRAFEAKQDILLLAEGKRISIAVNLSNTKRKGDALAELERRLGCEVQELANRNRIKELHVSHVGSNASATSHFTEGLLLGNYQFTKYRPKADNLNTLASVKVAKSSLGTAGMRELKNMLDATFIARDLVNEPLSYLTAPQFSKEIRKHGKASGLKVTVFNKKKITEMGMGGLLAVNFGSIDPPTFNIMEWKPKKAKNSQPIVFVGKGVVYDTGGLSLKPTANSMDMMKCDMGGAAAVVGAMYAIAKNKLPYHVIALVPATDNRPGGNAYAPGDVIKMYSGKTVEVLNTDAEGRMIMADALHYADRYKPEIVIDLATLTGAAARAIGPYGVVGMSNSGGESKMKELKKAGEAVYERIAEMPFWEEYGEDIKSEVADIKNIGGAYGGAITAGKFLEHFTNYPWIHLDIAGAAFLHSALSYRTKHGTGVGVRLLYQFVKNYK